MRECVRESEIDNNLLFLFQDEKTKNRTSKQHVNVHFV